MLSGDELFDSVLLPMGESSDLSGDFLNEGTGTINGTPWQEPGYEGSIDYRIRQLSYSSLLTLHSCPREYQLYKLRTTHRAEESLKSTITFSFGHIIGDAFQKVFQGLPLNDILFGMFLGWKPDIFQEDERLNKSLWSAIIAVKRFVSAREAGYLSEYELVYHNDKPACELSFRIVLPDGFNYRGHVDVVLRNRDTGEIVVLEIKTTGATTTNPTQWKNSAQAIGYSIVLDAIFSELSSYKVLYLVYNTKQGEFSQFPFSKSYLQRALWIRELLLDIDTIKMYEAAEIYPMHGESCMRFGRECSYLNSCTLSTALLTKQCTAEEEDTVEYSINIGLVDLINKQMEKDPT